MSDAVGAKVNVKQRELIVLREDEERARVQLEDTQNQLRLLEERLAQTKE